MTHLPALLTVALALPSFAPPVGLAAAGPDELLRESDQKKLAKLVAEYWEARLEVEGIQAAFDDLAQEIDDFQKRLDEGQNLLASIEDWEKVFWLATERGLDKPRTGRILEDDDDTPPYTFHVGRGYRSSRGPYGLMFVLPDEGQTPEAALEAWQESALLDGLVLVAVHLPKDASTWSSEEGVFTVMNTYGRVARANQFGFDYDRVFLAGIGKGFAAAAATADAYPQLFAGLVGRGDIPAADPRNFRNLPSRIPDAGEGADAFHARVQELEFDNCTRGEDTEAAVWSWLEELERDSYPQHLSFWPPNARAKGAHWLYLDGISVDAEPRVDAVADRASNTITIDAQNVSSVRVYFNDELVDLNQPVRVVVNGTTHEELGARNRMLMIDLAFDQGDWGRVFTKVASFEVPLKSSE